MSAAQFANLPLSHLESMASKYISQIPNRHPSNFLEEEADEFKKHDDDYDENESEETDEETKFKIRYKINYCFFLLAYLVAVRTARAQRRFRGLRGPEARRGDLQIA